MAVVPFKCDPKTESELIEYIGNPIYKCHKDGFTIFYYNQSFVGNRIHGFRDVWFKVKDGQVIDDYGHI